LRKGLEVLILGAPVLTSISLNKVDLFDTTQLDAEFNAHRAKKEQQSNGTSQEPTQESHGEGQAGAGEADGEN
jgi:hypothetical protein